MVFDRPIDARRNVALFGVSTYKTSVSPRSSTSTPQAIRTALERYSTWSWAGRVDLAEYVAVVDHGDVEDPDGDGARERLAMMLEGVDAPLAIFLGGDNAATWHAMGAFAGGASTSSDWSRWTPISTCATAAQTAHPCVSSSKKGSILATWSKSDSASISNSPAYARDSLKRGVRIVERDAFHREDAAVIARRALEVARQGGRKVYVDIDLDVADRSVVPGCPASAPGGLSADEVRRFVREIASSPHVVAIDFTEIDVDQDAPDQRTVRLAALLVLEALAGVQRRLS